jgi:hypothetical protein
MELVKWTKVQAERVGAAVCVALGAVSLLLGWLGVSDKIYPGEQIPYIASGGLLGVCLVGIGAVLWLSADLRDEWRKLDRIEELMQAGLYTTEHVPPPAVSSAANGAPAAIGDLKAGARP